MVTPFEFRCGFVVRKLESRLLCGIICTPINYYSFIIFHMRHACLRRHVDYPTTIQLHDCQPDSHSRPRHLQSSDSLTCVVRRAHNTYGDRCFATAGPQVWNSLPIELQQCDSLGRFKRCLKTFLFGSWNYGAL